MRLYRHSTLCSTAVQMFLQWNPQYWSCIPMKEIDANEDDHLYTAMCTNIVHLSMDETLLTRTDEQIQLCIDRLPVPPSGYRFSQRQRDEQQLFFKYKRDLIPPLSHHDLYRSTILFVCMFLFLFYSLCFLSNISLVPDHAADFVRRFIESLLITHTESKLNTAGHLAPEMKRDHRLAHGQWIEQLIRPSFLP